MHSLFGYMYVYLRLPSRPDAPDARPVVNDVRQASREDRALIEAVRRVRGLEGI